MAKKVERTKEEMGAFFEAHDGFNDFISKKIEAENAKKKKEDKEDEEVKDAMGIKK